MYFYCLWIMILYFCGTYTLSNGNMYYLYLIYAVELIVVVTVSESNNCIFEQYRQERLYRSNYVVLF